MNRYKDRLTYNPHTGNVCKLVRRGVRNSRKGWFVTLSAPKARWSKSRVFLYNDEIDIFTYKEAVRWALKVLELNYKE